MRLLGMLLLSINGKLAGQTGKIIEVYFKAINYQKYSSNYGEQHKPVRKIIFSLINLLSSCLTARRSSHKSPNALKMDYWTTSNLLGESELSYRNLYNEKGDWLLFATFHCEWCPKIGFLLKSDKVSGKS